MSTADPDEATAGFGEAFAGLRVEAAAADRPCAFDFQHVVTERFSLNRMRCSGTLRAVGPLPESIAVGRRTEGDVDVRRGGTSVDTSKPYLRPVAPSELEVRAGAVSRVTLHPPAVVDSLERGGERGAIRDRSSTAPRLAAWNLVMDHATAYLDAVETLTPTVEDELHDLLCRSLLHAFDDPWAETRRAGARSTALRRALQHLDAHAGRAVTMPEVAAEARVSLRELGLLFRRELDTTPHRWLQDLRLDRARAELLAGGGSVRDVALRNGIPHAGRFAAQYRARFHEHPATTLREREQHTA